jgi:adenylate cyclase
MTAGRRLLLYLGAVAVIAPLLALGFSEARVGRALERRAYDGWFTLRGELPKPDGVVVVAIDADSEESLGRYPWSREWHARLIANLHRAGAAAIGFDATFADAFPETDAGLRAVIDDAGTVILGAKTTFLVHRAGLGMRLEEPAGALQGAPLGIVDIMPDALDGVIREYPITHRYPQGVVPQLGVAALLRAAGLPDDSIVETTAGWRIGDRHIPRGPGGGMLIDFLGMPGSVATYSYVSVVDDAGTDIGDWDSDSFEDYLAEDRFRGRIVLIGTTIPEHQDLHPTPFRDAAGTGSVPTPGVEIHAHAVATILAGSARRALPRPVQYAWTVLLGILVVVVSPRLRGVRGALLSGAAAAVALLAAWFLFTRHGVWLWSVAPVLSAGLSYAGSVAVLSVLDEREKARIREMFQQYVAASVVDELIRRPELLALGGEERVATVLFSDVAGFSGVSERLTPTQLVELLNEYLTAMTDIVLAHGGIIDKYQGDALMAEFGVPVPLPDHALRACRAAVAMRAELARLREGWMRQGRPPLHARIGINTGSMLVGNLGSRRIMDYTVMGDHVNLASRLEGTNKVYGTEILVSEFTWREAESELIGREIDRVRVVGKEEPVSVYEIVATREAGADAATLDLLRRFELALGLYRARDFDAALDALLAITADFPDDPPTRVYIERCRAYLAKAPAPGWDGVYGVAVK